MQPRKPTKYDQQRFILIYTDGTPNPDPNQYTIWFAGAIHVVNRMKNECADTFYKRVCNDVDWMRKIPGPAFKRIPDAHVFSGIPPTAEEIAALNRTLLIKCFTTIMFYSTPPLQRVEAASSLGNLVGMFPPQANHMEVPFC